MTLADRIRKKIQKEGPIPVSEYMAMALGDVESGYYMTRDPLGLSGDFVTAPEISQIFGELVGIWLAECWQQMGTPKAHLVELGPGRGTLMNDLLRATCHISHFHDAVSVHMVETSPVLKQVQQETLRGKHPRIQWHESLPELDGPLLLVANEFFDALPIRQFTATATGFTERMVEWDKKKESFSFGESKERKALPGDYPVIKAGDLPEGSLIETCPLGQRIFYALSSTVAKHGGALLVIDYGYTRPDAGQIFALGDTLQAAHAHHFSDVLENPGEADITAHVDFSTLAAVAESAGAVASPVLSQREFLLKMGGKMRLEQLMKNAPTADQQDALVSGLERLVSPDEMGNLFKVMAVTHPDLKAPVLG